MTTPATSRQGVGARSDTAGDEVAASWRRCPDRPSPMSMRPGIERVEDAEAFHHGNGRRVANLYRRRPDMDSLCGRGDLADQRHR